MSDNSKIEWCDATWQVTAGCEKIASGCRNCYAIRDAHRLSGNPNPKISEPRKGTTHRVGSLLDWTGVVRTLPQNLDWPLRKKKPLRIFVNSNSDLFHRSVPFEFIAAVYGVMAACPQHTFIILTKRPARMREFHEWSCHSKHLGFRQSDVWRSAAGVHDALHANKLYLKVLPDDGWKHGDSPPLPNVIHGYSASTQADLDAGIADLLATPSALRCLSLEPLVGPINVEPYLGNEVIAYGEAGKRGVTDFEVKPPRLHWVIVGGESGPGARTFHVEHAISIRDQCKAAGVAFFLKQVGSLPHDERANERGWPGGYQCFEFGVFSVPTLKNKKGGDPSEWPETMRWREFPKLEVARA